MLIVLNKRGEAVKVHIYYRLYLAQNSKRISPNRIIQSNEIHNVVALIKCLLVLRCQLCMFRTVTVHPQELPFRCCMCRLWYVVRTSLSDMSCLVQRLRKKKMVVCNDSMKFGLKVSVLEMEKEQSTEI